MLSYLHCTHEPGPLLADQEGDHQRIAASALSMSVHQKRSTAGEEY
jgi:hypothetical protein